MSTIVTRQGKGLPLTNSELDANFINLNADKLEAGALTPYLLSATAAATYQPIGPYLTGITSGQVTTALGFTPYNATNPAGYITSSALSPYLTSSSAASTYLPLIGGTVSGAVTFSAGTANGVAYLNGSKVLTTGSALTFDGSAFWVAASSSSSDSLNVNGFRFGSGTFKQQFSGGFDFQQFYTAAGQATPQASVFADTAAWGVKITGSEQMRLTSTGLLVGTTTAPLSWGSATPKMRVTAGGIQVGDYSLICEDVLDADSLCLIADSTENMCFGAYNRVGNTYSERMRLDASGNLLVGTTSAPTGGFANANVSCSSVFANISGTVSGNIAVLNAAHQGSEYYGLMLKNLTTVASTAIVFINSSNTAAGSVSVTATTAAYNTSSDYRLKNTVAPITGALAKVSALRPVTYKWNIDGSDGEGFIAHELAEVCPQAVTGEKDAVDAEGKPKYQGIDTTFLVATLTAAIQEQQAIITAMTARVAALESN